jgi:hypothetical protein
MNDQRTSLWSQLGLQLSTAHWFWVEAKNLTSKSYMDAKSLLSGARGNTKWCIQSLCLLLPNIVMHRARVCYEFLGCNPTAWTATVFSVVGMRRWGLHFPPALSTPSIAQKNTSVSMVTICHGNRTSRRVHAHDDPSRRFHNWPPICRVHRMSFQTSYPVMYRVMISRPIGHTGFVFRPRPQNNEPLNRGSRDGLSRARARPGMLPWSWGGRRGRRDSGPLARSKASRLLWRFFAWGVVWIRALLHCRSAFLKCVEGIRSCEAFFGAVGSERVSFFVCTMAPAIAALQVVHTLTNSIVLVSLL